ncbi:hypothetical protein EVC45_38205 [Paraburkholderia sp. UYCP14C]|uniref:hypothetical protein n=1 Tax=Paraburkholderia sp. UYCP14C TaxID=2511130 RepID=UPI00101F08D2|nr:hypothetical protein [Paraburkholderia sp. UYCP14C]RZF24569.1 hypothetical protein EVC45_38205 [Paraburkholderia sp. UYCP14C]
MGIGMQIAYVGFSGTASLESEAAMQLLRLQPYAAYVSDCCLSIERLGTSPANSVYEVCLFIGMIKSSARRLGRCIRDNAEAAIRCAFNIAVRTLELLSLHCRL